MAKRGRKKTPKYARKNTRSKAQARREHLNISVIATIVFSVLLAVLLYTNSGTVGQNLNEVLGGLMGSLRYILPIGTFAIAIRLACQDEDDYISR